MGYPTVRMDAAANAAYLALQPIGNGESAEQVPVETANGEVFAVLDLSSEGRLLGVEVLDAGRRLPRSLLEQLEE